MIEQKLIKVLGGFFCGALFLIAPPLKAQSPSFDEYIQPDAKDDKFFTIKKKYHGKGIPRSYVEKMARPSLPEKALSGGQQFPMVLPKSPGDNTIVGDILVVEANSNLVQQGQGGAQFSHGGQGMYYMVHRVLAELGDNYDVISVFTTFDDQSVAAYYMPLRNDVSGLGECNMNAGRTFGCQFDNTPGIITGGMRLQGFVYMNSVATWRNWDANYSGAAKDVSDIEHAVYATLGQEVAHRWGSGLRFIDPRNGTLSNKLLGRDMSHWAAFVDTDASVMDGWNWEPIEGGMSGTFEVTEALKRYSTLDLYTMGALPVASAKPFFFIDNAVFRQAGQFLDPRPVRADEVLQMPTPEFLKGFNVVLSATGDRVDLTIQDIVDAEGNRCPDPDHSPKTFRQAFVLLTNTNQSLAQVNTFIGELDIVRKNWEIWWSDRVSNAMTLCTGLQTDCLHAETAIGKATLTELGVEDGIIDIGEDFDVEIPISVTGDQVDKVSVDMAFYGNGAENLSYYESDSVLSIKDVAADTTETAKIAFAVDPAYVCGHSTLINVTVSSEKSPPVTETLRIFPGYQTLFEENFESSDHDFIVNEDGADSVSSGKFERAPVYLSCDMTVQTPERDASLGGDTAFITGTSTPLNGSTSLWSPAVSLKDAIVPEIRFSYWFDGASGDDMRVAVSEDGVSWKKALDVTESEHRWVQGRVIVEEIFGYVPEQVSVRFVFTSNSGLLEGGIDEVRVLSLAGQCVNGFCSCDSTTESPQWFWGVLAFGVLFRVRRRRLEQT